MRDLGNRLIVILTKVFSRTSIDELENQQVPHPVEADGSFMYVHGNPESKAGIIAMAEATQEFKCMTFDYALEVN